MTAEKWLPLEYVEPSGLKEYLQQKKSEGYILVGAEQVRCHDYCD